MTFFRPNAVIENDMPKLEQLGRGIYRYKNFLDDELLGHILQLIETTDQETWGDAHWSYKPGDTAGSFWDKRTGPYISQFDRLFASILIFFSPEFSPVGAYRVINRLLPRERTDVEMCLSSNGRNNHANLGAKWKLGIYFGEFTGGDLIFPDFNLSVKVEQNDLVVWKANYDHYVAPVTQGIRYSYSDFLIPPCDSFFA